MIWKRKILIPSIIILLILLIILNRENIQDIFENENEKNIYLNNNILSCECKNGYLSVGVESNSTEKLYLNIRNSVAIDGNEVGYYIESSRGNIETSSNIYTNSEAKENMKYSNFIILDRLYSEVVTTEYHNLKDYGISWKDDIKFDGQLGGADISIRCVNITNGDFYGIYELKIEYDDKGKTYKIKSLKAKEDALKGDEKKMLLANAIPQITNIAGTSPNTISESYIEKVDSPYFSILLGKRNETIRNYEVSSEKLYAVTSPVSYLGYVTTYYIRNNGQYEYVGYDALMPRDEYSLIAPINFYHK